jgi:hypothetical protein
MGLSRDVGARELAGLPRVQRVKYSAQSAYIPMGDPFQEVFGPGRSLQSDLIRDGEIRSVLVGGKRGRRMIETASYREYVERQKQREAAGEIGMASPNPRARKRQPAAASPPRTIERPQANARARQLYGSSRRSS